jgi:DNA-binding transcriptional MerR regulator
MDIGEVSKRSGIRPSALRYYEEIKLITSTGRNGLRRQYAPSVLEKLALITLAKEAGFSLEELHALFKSNQKDILDREQLKKKASEIDKKIKKLEAVKNGLIHASNCKAPNHLECPKFNRLLAAATKSHKRQSK